MFIVSMDARNDQRGRGEPGDGPVRCAACGGDLKMFVEIPPHGRPYEQDHPVIRYFRCGRCAQIRIVDA